MSANVSTQPDPDVQKHSMDDDVHPRPEDAGPGWIVPGITVLLVAGIIWMVSDKDNLPNLINKISAMGHPSAGDAEKLIRNQIAEQSNGRIKLVSFKKTNGQKGELLGVRLYTIEYEAEIEFLEDCKWVKFPFESKVSFKTSKLIPNNANASTALLDFWGNPGVAMKRGQRKKVSGSLMFEKADNGWRHAKL